MKLFASFSGLLRALARNDISQDELDQGLYFFSCVRRHAFEPGFTGEFDERTSLGERGPAAHTQLVQALERAETEGRCAWYRPTIGRRLNPYEQLSKLLQSRGLPAFEPRPEYDPDRMSLPWLRDAVAQTHPQLEFFY